MPPPELHLGKWRKSIERLKKEHFTQIAPTHFGQFDDVDWHLPALDQALDDVETFIDSTLPSNPTIELLDEGYLEWARNRSMSEGLSPDQIEIYETANPSWMSTFGIQRYWRKYRSKSYPSKS